GGVVVDDVGALATEFEREPLGRTGDRSGDLTADLRGAGEGDLVGSGVFHELASGLPRTGKDVDHAGGQVRLLTDLGENQRGERRGLGRLEHHGVSGGQGGGALPREPEQREVTRGDL